MIVDELCPMWDNVSNNGIKTKGKQVFQFLRAIDLEAKERLKEKKVKPLY